MKDTKIFRILKKDKKWENEIKEKRIKDTEIHLEGIFVRF